LLFWLSLIPFATHWMGENHLAPLPTALYGVVMLCSALSYTLLQSTIIAGHGPMSTLAQAVGGDVKGKLSVVLYVVSIPLAFWQGWTAVAIFVGVALMWLVPDRRIESSMSSAE